MKIQCLLSTVLLVLGLGISILSANDGPTHEETVAYIESKFNECGKFKVGVRYLSYELVVSGYVLNVIAKYHYTGENDPYRRVFTATEYFRLHIVDDISSIVEGVNKVPYIGIGLNKDISKRIVYEGSVAANCGHNKSRCEDHMTTRSHVGTYLSVCDKDTSGRLVNALRHLRSLALAGDKDDPFAPEPESETEDKRPPIWMTAENQPCQVWNSSPAPGRTVVIWTGACVGGKASGKGRLVWQTSKGAYVYEGQYQDGMMHGQGIYTYPDGHYYDGEWRGDQSNGYGIEIWANGARYEGEWHDDKPHGQGIYKDANGQRFEGLWQDGCFGKRDGRWAYIYTTRKKCGFE